MANTIVQVSTDGSRLVTESGITLYYFMPQRYDPTHNDSIPWMANFPTYLAGWIEDWVPLVGQPTYKPTGNNKSRVTQADFGYIVRGGNPDKGADQPIFRNWYLFTYNGDEANQINGEVNGLWQKVTPDLINLGHYLGTEGQLGEAFLGGP